MSINIKNLRIDNNSFGKKFFLVNQEPYYSYVDGKKTDKKEGMAFDVAVVEQGLEKLRVKIPDPELSIDMKNSDMVIVYFDNLEIGFYQDFRNNNQIKFKANATGIKKAGEPVK